jgi:hypothetical protein
MAATHHIDPNAHPALTNLLTNWKGLEIEDLEILAWQIAQNLDLVGQIVGCAQGIHGAERVADQLVQYAPATCAEVGTEVE